MEIHKERTGDRLRVGVSGRLDTLTAPQLEAELAELTGVNALVFDFAGLDYISSAGLRVLLTVLKRLPSPGGVSVVNLSPVVREVFDMTGFSTFLRLD